MASRWLPRKATRALRYALLASAILALCWSRGCTPSSSSLSSIHKKTRDSPVDFAWGSIVHRYQNHPRAAQKRSVLPWRNEGSNGSGGVTGGGKGEGETARTRVLIVTSELAGLHKNGGIGTAFTELAQTLAGEEDFETSILVSHVEEQFAVKKLEALRKELSAKRISLFFVSTEPQPFWPQAWTPTASMRVWNYLRAHDGEYDIIHFPDNTGIGFFSALGRFEGLALQASQLVVGLHGADVEWAAMLNKRYPTDKYAVELAVFERRTAELADAVVAPSEYMLEYVRSRGWELPSTALVIPNVVALPSAAELAEGAAGVVEPITELVFFGRLEERKGTRLLVATLEALYSDPSFPRDGLKTITFLGRDQPDIRTRTDVSVLVGSALESIKEYTNATFSYQFLKTYDRDEALAYLQQPHRLALLPSLADNSPSTVLECIAHGIRFVASNVGGVPELVHPDDQPAVLFSPLVGSFSAKLLSTISHLSTSPWSPVRPAIETQTAAVDWVGFHRHLVSLPPSTLPSIALAAEKTNPFVSILITHYERPHLISQLLDSLLAQSYTNFEVILVDDGSTSPAALAGLDALENRYFSPSSFANSSLPSRTPWHLHRHPNAYLGEARNRAFSHSSPSSAFLLFLDDDDVLKPHALSTLVGIAARTGAAALSTWLDEFATDVNPLELREEGEELPHRRTYWFLGQELSAGLLSNCFGSGNVFVRRQAFEKLGGFSTYREVGAEDWEFWTRLALLEGEKQYVVPEELIFVRSDPARDSMKFSMDPWDAHFHATVPLLNDDRIQDLGLAHSLMLLKSAVTREPAVRAFADSRDDFQLVQGWGGWHYSFEAVESGELESEGWSPSLKQENLGVVELDTFVMDRNHPKKPYVDDINQEGWIGTDGKAVVAVRSFRAPKRMDIAIELTYRSHHKCGDGTELSLISVGGPGEEPVEHVRWRTDEDSFAEYDGDVSLRPGSYLHLISHPLANDECDRVEVRLKVTPISLDNKSWSALAKKAAVVVEQERKATLNSTHVPAVAWAKVETGGPNEDEVFNIALIFDRNRFPHAKSVIRSAREFLTSPRLLVFHLITPKEIHSELEDFFAGENMTLRLYDHTLCAFSARQILPFSDPDIHVSAHCKMFLPEIITFAERILYLDTDVTVVSDLARCYNKPLKNPAALVSMGIDMGDACQRNPDQCWPIGMHWRVPPGLECGNVPARHDAKSEPASCAEEGELETVQVNGGVALFELTRMKEQGFVERYVQSVVHHYRLMGGKKATWGEQDFVNSYFRLFPADLELLPCGCNYQWFGTRREVKCGEQEVSIAHHWSHGIARRTEDPYNILFHHFVSNESSTVPLPPVPLLSPSLPGASNSSSIAIEHSLNCPRQAHDCSLPFTGTEYGQPVLILTRVLGETFAADQVDSIDSQTYPKVSHAVAVRTEVDVPAASGQVMQIELPADPAEEYALLCDACGDLALEGASCSTPSADAALRKRFYDCVCRLEDQNALVMFDLEAASSAKGLDSWILYLDDTVLFVAPESLSLLMAQVDSRDKLVLFRSNTSTLSSAQEFDFKRKILSRSTLDGVGFIFHSSNLDVSDWSASSRCGRWATLTRLTERLKIKWLDLVPTMEHPLQRHLPATPAEDFQLSVVILETQGKISWTALALEVFEMPELMPLVKEVVVASIDTEEGAYGEIRVVNPTVGSGMKELASFVESEKVLLLSDSVLLDKPAIVALLTHHLLFPSRLVGLFTETEDRPSPDSPFEFSLPLPLDPDDFDLDAEPDALVGSASPASYTHLLPRALLISRENLLALSSALSSSSPSSSSDGDPEPLHPICHPLLLTYLSAHPPLRVLPPEKSVVDRVHDCRVRNWPEVGYGRTAGDWAVKAQPEDDEEDEYEEEEEDADEEDEERGAGKREKKDKRTPPPAPLTDDDLPLPPSFAECLDSIAALLSLSSPDDVLKPSDDVGISGPLGAYRGVEKVEEVGAERWMGSRRMEKCYKV